MEVASCRQVSEQNGKAQPGHDGTEEGLREEMSAEQQSQRAASWGRIAVRGESSVRMAVEGGRKVVVKRPSCAFSFSAGQGCVVLVFEVDAEVVYVEVEKDGSIVFLHTSFPSLAFDRRSLISARDSGDMRSGSCSFQG